MPRATLDGTLYTRREILAFRLLGLVATLVVVGMGVVHHTVDASSVDPLWGRVVVAGACLFGTAVTFFDRGRVLRGTLYGVIAIVTVWIVHLVYLNDFSEQYGFGLLIVIAVASALFRDLRALAIYLGVCMAAVGVVGSAISEPEVSPLLYMAFAVVLSILLFVILGARLRSERELAESEERYILAAEGSKDGLWDWDLVRDRIHFSDRWKELLGWKPDEIGAEPSEWLDRVHPADRPALESELERLRDGGIEHLEHEYRMIHRSGEPRWMLTRGAAVRDGRGRALRMAGSQTDLTERVIRDQRSRLQRLESIGRLAGGIAHDLNNLLTVVTGNAQMVLLDLPKDHGSRGDVEAIYRTTRQAADLIRQLVVFSRTQSVDLQVADLNALVNEAAPKLERLLEEPIHLETRLEEGLRPVRIDPSQMQQVIVNLVLNARDAMPEGGPLVLQTENVELGPGDPESHDVEPGAYVALRVLDTGGGMDAHTLEHAFDPFFTTREREKGTGLGLATAFGVVKRSGGHIRAESVPDEGSTVVILLPAVETP